MNALPALVLLPIMGGGLAWMTGRMLPDVTPSRHNASWWVVLATLTVETLVLAMVTFAHHAHPGPWLEHFSMPWIPAMGIAVRLDMDGLSLSLVWLSLILCFLCTFLATGRVTAHAGAFHFLFLATLTGIIGTFLATDLFLFFFFWELMLVPMFVLIAAWGHEDRQRAAMKFFMFTQGSGLLMLLSILGLVIAHARQTGVLTFDYFALAHTPLSPALSMLLMAGFFIAFAVKLPVVPVHVWLPDAHTQAPTAASVLLAGILLKTGGYGMIRFNVMLFPDAASRFAPIAMGLGVAGILYGAWLSCAQDDVKRLIAYSSISHMGFVLLGIFAGSRMGMQGAIMQMLAHGLGTAALFLIAGAIQDRLHTRDMYRIGGLWAAMPRLSGTGVFFAVASLGMPGLGNFTGEFLVLLATWHVSPETATLAAMGLVPAAIYALRMVNRIFLAAPRADLPSPEDFPARHMAVFACIMTFLIVLGLYPQPFTTFSAPSSPSVTTTARQEDHAP
ncbi:NuoM family protein [Komagataeibacter sp. FNDCF1]|uniref:complex I subunit 4 family protein n=1 Tax=Komagataeibacter sp. FNDCF1 TaxID=2878681 RepID=UPI001E2EF1FB|nr:NADH-quinone oxidoreductase subunit M [Komagataeibacter sp. FNDCF1]MCE2564572.1 NADH-quinone oxidoreductase subunit M [Komagataeibacter sp. FNDCF1]